MKKRILSFILFIFAGTLFAGLNGHIRLLWDYPPDQVTNVNFVVHYSTNLNLILTNWPVVITTYTTNVDFDINPGAYFFYVTASNFWGEVSPPSNVVNTPAVPLNTGNTRIIKIP